MRDGAVAAALGVGVAVEGGPDEILPAGRGLEGAFQGRPVPVVRAAEMCPPGAGARVSGGFVFGVQEAAAAAARSFRCGEDGVFLSKVVLEGFVVVAVVGC